MEPDSPAPVSGEAGPTGRDQAPSMLFGESYQATQGTSTPSSSCTTGNQDYLACWDSTVFAGLELRLEAEAQSSCSKSRKNSPFKAQEADTDAAAAQQREMSLRLSAACGPVLVESLRASSGFARVLEEDTAPQEVHAACCADLVESVAIEGGEALIVGVAGRDRAAHSLLGLTGVPSRAPEAGAVIRAAVQLLVAGAQDDEAIEDVQGPHEGCAAANAEAAASVSDIVVGHDERPHSRARPAHAPAELSLRAVALEAQEGGETRFVDLLAGDEGEPGSASASDVSCSPTTPETATWAPVPSVPALLAALSRSTMPYLASRRGGAEPDAITLVTLRALRGEGAAACASTLHFAACVAGPEASSAGSPAAQLRAALVGGGPAGPLAALVTRCRAVVGVVCPTGADEAEALHVLDWARGLVRADQQASPADAALEATSESLPAFANANSAADPAPASPAVPPLRMGALFERPPRPIEHAASASPRAAPPPQAAASAANAVLAEAVRAWADRPEGSLLDILVSDRVFGALESYRASVRGAPAGGRPLARGGPGAPAALRSSDILGALERTVASSDGDWMLRSHRPGEASQREASARPLPTLREHWADFASGAARALGAKRAHLAGDAAHPAPPEVDVSGAEDGAEHDPGHVTPPSAEDAKTKSSWRVKSKMAIKRMMHSMKPRSAQGSWARI